MQLPPMRPVDEQIITNPLPPQPQPVVHKDHEKSILIWKWVGKIGLLVFTIFAFARIPFIGSYLDGLIDYVFGQGKYLFYLLAIFMEVGWIFQTNYLKVVKTKRFIFFSFIALLSACCIISGVANMINSFTNPPSFSELITNYHNSWFAYLKHWDYGYYFNKGCISGGILAELLSYLFNFLSYVVLIVVASFVLVTTIFIIFNINYRSTKVGLKIRSWMIRKLGGTFKYDGYNELKSERENQNKFKKSTRADIENVAMSANSIPYSLLPDSDVNKFDGNFKYARQLQIKLTTLFRNKNIDCVPTDINVYSAFSEICFEAKNKTEVQNMVALQPLMARVMKLDKFNVSINENVVCIEVDNAYFSKYSLKTVLNVYDVGKDVTAVFGLDKTNKLIMQNFRENSSAMILGKKGSGAATLTVLMALSTCYITSPDDMDLVVLNPNCEATYTYFRNLPHTNNKVYESMNECIEQLHTLQNTINERIALLQAANVESIDQYNKNLANTQPKLKHILVIIGNFDTILRETFQNNKTFSSLLNTGAKAGVYIVLQSYTVNNDVIDPIIFDNVSDKYILALSNKDESEKIFKNDRGCLLHSNGDCLHYHGKRQTSMERVQVCNLNYSELTIDVDIIKTFYATKQKQKEDHIISEAKDDKTI